MTGPQDSSNTRPISVAELLAKNGTIGAPVPNRRRRRRGNSDAVTVAELTGEIPVIDDSIEPEAAGQPVPESRAPRANGSARLDELVSDEPAEHSRYWSEPEPRWPESPPPRPRESRPESRESRPERSPYPLPSRNNVRVDASRSGGAEDQLPDRSGAEGMNPDPLEDYAGMSVDVMDTDVRDAELGGEDSAYVRSYLRSFAGRSRGKSVAGDVESRPDAAYRDVADIADEEDYPEDLADDFHDVDGDAHPWSRTETMRAGGMVVLQSILAVGFGAGLFIAFDQLWRWNNIVALVLSVLVILGLVVGVRVVRKTEDIGSTLIAVAVGALVTLGPLALLQSG
ncbi:MAG: hypothetical protein WB785_07020 [Mycobacterium sp.]|uniref:hypothetical protein n=1 Tax=Mycobacterium sp. TaxID=1785 RepID=UPI003C525BF3